RPHPCGHEGHLGGDGLRDAPQATARCECGRRPPHARSTAHRGSTAPGEDPPLGPGPRRRGRQGEAVDVLAGRWHDVRWIERLEEVLQGAQSGTYQGRLSRVAFTTAFFPRRTTSMSTASPIFFSRIASTRSPTPATGLSATDTITSPTSSPAFAPGPPSFSSPRNTPRETVSP